VKCVDHPNSLNLLATCPFDPSGPHACLGVWPKGSTQQARVLKGSNGSLRKADWRIGLDQLVFELDVESPLSRLVFELLG